jgi:type VI secretion system protein ImpJ
MNSTNKLYWPRTMHLLPAHLQTRDGYVEDLLSRRTDARVPDAYGASDLAFDEAAGARGEVVVQRLEAILPSGLVVRADPKAPLRRTVTLAPGAPGVSREVYIAVPRVVLRGPNVTLDASLSRSTRYQTVQSGAPGELTSIEAKPEIRFDGELHEGLEAIRIGRIECLGQGLRFDREAIPTALRVRASIALEQRLRTLIELLETRRRELVRYRADHPFSLRAAVGEDLPALQLSVVLQRHLPLLAELLARRSAHPHELYDTLASLHGSLLVFGASAEVAPAYDHERPGAVFPWLFARIGELAEVAARNQTTILPFRRVDATTFRLSFERGDLVGKRPLLVLTGGDDEFLREKVPGLLKMASPTAIAPLLNSAVRGVAVAVEFEPPPIVPRRKGAVAYRIDVRDALWLDIEDRRQIQLNLVGAPPALEAFLYGVERTV